MRPSSAPPPRPASRPPPGATSPAANAHARDVQLGRIGERYLVQEELGRGGMAVVYRVVDASSGQAMALKQLTVETQVKNREALQALFEAEFRTLAELDHPRVIQVDDYGIDARGAYYTMELLDGGNLTQRSPLPWRQACALIHDVCSSLALLHSRSLIHRDVSPHNVRCTSTGRAKLIDFGAMVQMGPCTQPVGTPAFMAPEVAQRGTLDARTDLFSLGATMYFALTGRPAYPARSFAQLLDVWSKRPAPPSAYSAEIPERLDALVMRMLGLDPAVRPRSAFEVMSQLQSVAELGDHEVIEVSQAYLAAPQLIGRAELLDKVQRRTTRAKLRRGGGLLVDGSPGLGRSRALSAAALQAKIAGLLVVHACARLAGHQPFALATRVLHQLARLAPVSCMETARGNREQAALLFEGFDDASPAEPVSLTPRSLSEEPRLRRAQQQALTHLCLELTRRHTLALAIDNIDDADEPSSAWLAGLVDRARRRRLLLIFTARSANLLSGTQATLDVIAQHCSRVSLPRLTAEQLERLCGSIFGAVPYVSMCADRVYRVGVGNPRASMDLLRHLVEHKLIRYEGGNWVLPERLDADALPASMDESYALRASKLSSDALWLAQAHALTRFSALSAADHRELMADRPAGTSEAARAELLAGGLLTGQHELTLVDEAWTRTLLSRLDETTRSTIHRKLAELGAAPLRHPIAVAYHFQCAGEDARALEPLVALGGDDLISHLSQLALPVTLISEVVRRAHDTAQQLGRSEREINELRRIYCGLSISSQADEYQRLSPAWLASLRRDAGLDDWDALAEVPDAGQRLMQALTRAAERYNATPEQARGYSPTDAIKALVNYVVVSIAIASRTFDAAELRSLPRLLQPFAALSPIVDAIFNNATATYEYIALGQIQRARERWLGVLERLRDVQGDALEYVGAIRGAIAYALGLIEILRGYGTATEWASLLDGDELQRVNAIYLRRVARLQLGDVEGAERLRQKAELLAVTANTRQMFDSMLVPELIVYGLAADLTGLQQVAERLRAVTERYPAWACYERLALVQLALLHGAYDEALAHSSMALASCEPDARDPRRCHNAWPWVASARGHALLGAGRYEEARQLAAEVLEGCRQRSMDATEELVRVLSLAEARLGDYAGASRRLEALHADQEAAGIVGINLGATCEARARIAIWAGDREAIDKYGTLTAAAYAHGQGSPLGARYERLMSEARSRGVSVLPALTQFETSIFGTTALWKSAPNIAMVHVVLRAAATAPERGERALNLICDATGAVSGQLYLVDEAGMRLAATLGNVAHHDAYRELARDCLSRAVSEDGGETDVMSESERVVASTAGHSTSHTSMLSQRALLLTGKRDELTLHAGVAVVDAPPRRVITQEHRELFTIVANTLLGAADTQGVSADIDG